MASIPLKLPSGLLDNLQAQANRIGASRGALARALVARGLQEMEQPSAGD